jgi:AcrR family transcriptional regulator
MMDKFAMERPARPRMRQDEKSAETRRRLLDAAVACLVERGYANTTGSEIAERAGLSRGAQLYHFPTKEDLLVGAVNHLFELFTEEMQGRVDQIASKEDRRGAAIDFIWEAASSPLFRAWLELLNACRTDVFLRDSVRDSHRKAVGRMRETFGDLFGHPPHLPVGYDLVPIMIVLVIEGLSLRRDLLQPDVIEQVLLALKKLTSEPPPEGAAP